MQHTVTIEILDELSEREMSRTVQINDGDFDPEHQIPVSYLIAGADHEQIRPSVEFIESCSVAQPDRWTIIGTVDGDRIAVQGGGRFRRHLDALAENKPVGRIRIRPAGAMPEWLISFSIGDRTPTNLRAPRRPGARIQDGQAAALPALTQSGYRIDWTYVLSTPGSPLGQEADGYLYRLEA